MSSDQQSTTTIRELAMLWKEDWESYYLYRIYLQSIDSAGMEHERMRATHG